MWTVEARELFALREPSGRVFTSFVDDLIAVHSGLAGLPLAAIQTNQRTNKQDGGVDTEVRQAVPGDPTGWMGVPTCWQYKAVESADIGDGTLKEEVNKWYSQQLITAGYGYRLCICDDFPSYKKGQYEAILKAEILKINPAAPDPHVLNASDLVRWLQLYKGLAIRYFRPQLSQFHPIEVWRRNITDVTKHYVQVPAWADVTNGIKQHIDFSSTPGDPLVTLQAQPGVGKSRLVFEILSATPGASGITVYTNSFSDAEKLARSAANDSSQLILVADECPVESRVRISDILRGAQNKVRVVAIDNSFDRPRSGQIEFALDKILPDQAREILRRNFPHVSEENRSAYVEVTDGYIRMASDLCLHDAAIAAAGGIRGAYGGIRGYLANRLGDDIEFVRALSLVTKLGCAGEVSAEMTKLSAVVGLSESDMRAALTRVKERTGYVVRTPTYFYITPVLAADICFEDAWHRWVGANVQDFLHKLDGALLDSFQRRVARSGAPEVRQKVSDFFRQWARGLSPASLTDNEEVDRLFTLVNTDPDAYLPRLVALVQDADDNQLPGVADRWSGNEARRRLVWLAERLAAFPNYFEMAESILLRLGINESEKGISNNSRGLWKQLFQIAISGTAVPFSTRMELLHRRVFATESRISQLAIEALTEVFQSRSFRAVGPAIVAGQIVPPEWRPKLWSEYWDCERIALRTVRALAESADVANQRAAIDIVATNLRSLLRHGLLNDVKSVLSVAPIPTAKLPRLLESIDEYRRYDSKGVPDEHLKEVDLFVRALVPNDIHMRLVSVVGKHSWHHSEREEKSEWEKQVGELAVALIEDVKLFQRELKWLVSEEARSAGTFGEYLARLDKECRLLEMILSASLQHRNTGLAQGYVFAMLERVPEMASVLNKWLDLHFPESPDVARDVAFAAARHVSLVQRLVRGVDDGYLPIHVFVGLSYGPNSRNVSVSDMREILSRCLRTSDADGRRVALEILHQRLWLEKHEGMESILADSRGCELVWQLVDQAIDDESIDSYKLFVVLKILGKRGEAAKVAEFAGRGLISKSYGHREQSEQLLIDMAKSSPEAAMSAIVKAASDEKGGWLFHLAKYGELIQALPPRLVTEWLEDAGVAAARKIARHVPPPYLDANGTPSLHPVTEFLLTKFEDDQQTFNEFVAGVHALEVRSGDIAAEYEKEASIARRFRSHKLPRVREWADLEEGAALHRAEAMRKEDQERWLE